MQLQTSTRPRVEGEREDEILDATVELVMELGYDRLTMDAVAKRARASKATLYRRWESKASLVVEALIRAKESPHVGDHDTGTLRGDLLSTFCGHEGVNENATKVLGSVITALSTDPVPREVHCPEGRSHERDLRPRTAARRNFQGPRPRGDRPCACRNSLAPDVHPRGPARRRSDRARRGPRHPARRTAPLVWWVPASQGRDAVATH
jgi:AcrR family transcriptional regulator